MLVTNSTCVPIITNVGWIQKNPVAFGWAAFLGRHLPPLLQLLLTDRQNLQCRVPIIWGGHLQKRIHKGKITKQHISILLHIRTFLYDCAFFLSSHISVKSLCVFLFSLVNVFIFMVSSMRICLCSRICVFLFSTCGRWGRHWCRCPPVSVLYL